MMYTSEHRGSAVKPRVRLGAADAVFIGALVALGAVLRLYRLDTGLWFDEIVTLLDSLRQPLPVIVTHFPSNNDHPLYSVLGRISVVLFGEAPWAQRLPSALFGIAAIPMLYAMGRAVTSRHEALAAALVLTVSYHHIWFSQNARGYTALLFFVLLATYALVRWLETGRRSWLAVYAAAAALGSYAHLTMVLVSVSHALACALDGLLVRTSRVRTDLVRLAAGFVGAGVLTVVLYAPMLLDVGVFFATRTASENEVATAGWALLAAIRGMQVGFGTFWAMVLGAIVVLAGAWSYYRQRPGLALLFLLPIPVTVLSALALDRPVFPRFVFFAMGLVLLVIVRGAASAGAIAARAASGRLEPRRAAAGMVALVTVAAVILSARALPYGYRFPKQDYEGSVAFVEQARSAGDAIAVIGETAATPLQTYLGRPWPQIETAADLRALRAAAEEVWVVYTFPAYIEADRADLWAALQRDCAVAARFEGTVAGGTIDVRRCP